jgi:hypothetical protein
MLSHCVDSVQDEDHGSECRVVDMDGFSYSL